MNKYGRMARGGQLAMDFLKLHLGPPYHTLLRSVGHSLPPWTPHAVRLCEQVGDPKTGEKAHSGRKGFVSRRNLDFQGFAKAPSTLFALRAALPRPA
jgi:hypothetical protein